MLKFSFIRMYLKECQIKLLGSLPISSDAPGQDNYKAAFYPGHQNTCLLVLLAFQMSKGDP